MSLGLESLLRSATMQTVRTGVIVLAGLLAAGCGFLSSKPSTFYALDTIPTQSEVRAVSGLPVGIDSLALPPELDRREIAIRGANHQLELRGRQQWASPLEDMVTHTLAFDLADRLPEGMVVLPGQMKPASMRSLHVVLEELAAGPDRVFVLDGRWTVMTGVVAGETHRERITVPLESLESAAVAAGMSRALAELADRIVASL